MNEANFKRKLLSDPLLFTKYFFKNHYNRNFIVGGHHIIIANILKQVISLNITRLIINMPPRFGKTELVVRMFFALGFAFNSKSRFIHVSSSDKLVLDNSNDIKGIVKSGAYQDLWPIKIRSDTDSKGMWYTENGGGMIAAPAGGQIVGFGAGSIDSPYFSGAIVYDDPMKPQDAMSLVKRSEINNNFDSTVNTRLNSQKTPIIILGHRLHKNDLSGYVLSKDPKGWYHLSLPALKEDGTALWPFKLNVPELLHKSRINNYVFQTQYQQKTVDIKIGGEFLDSFDVNKHMLKVPYIDGKPIHLSIDNNVLPYIAVSFIQKNGNEIRKFHEIPCMYPDNTATKAGKSIALYLKHIGYQDVIIIHGDASGKNANTIDDNRRSFFTKIIESIKEEGFKTEDKISKSNPPVAMSGQFVNSIFSGNYQYSIMIDQSCITSQGDYINTKKDDEGGIQKKRITDPTTQQSYEEYGHFTDVLRYIIVDLLKDEFIKYKTGQMTDPQLIFPAWGTCESIPEGSEFMGAYVNLGFANKPTTIGKVFKYEGTIYIDEYCHAFNLTTTINPENPDQESVEQKLIDSGITTDTEVFSNKEFPKSVRELRDLKYNIRPRPDFPSWEVVAINTLKRWSVKVTTRSINIIDEKDNYKWKDDAQGGMENDPIDLYNSHINGIFGVALHCNREKTM